MSSVCLYLHVHQPRRIKRYRVFDIGRDRDYFGDTSDSDVNNARVFEKVARKSYLPTNALLLELLQKHPEFKVSFSITGIFLDQAEEYSPETIESFKRLVETGRVEILAETYHHSLAFLYSQNEFEEQVRLHADKINEHFGVSPTVFRNTEFIYNNDLARAAERMGYRGILTEGADHILGERSPNFVYRPKGTENISLLLKNYKLSDDIAFRFSQREWSEYPLTAEKFGNWVNNVNGSGEIVNLFMDYETFGEHQWEDTGIFEFLRVLPSVIYKHPDNDFVTPSEAIDRYERRFDFDAPDYISWADVERDLSAWLHNDMQQDAIKSLYEIEDDVKLTGDPKLLSDWRTLTTSDHFYYMCTKWWNDGDVHKYFSPYESPYEAFIAFMNVLHDLKLRI
ncbi:MAG: glycoside hydrolase family 57 protein [Candidatus Paceibacterota bacterium]